MFCKLLLLVLFGCIVEAGKKRNFTRFLGLASKHIAFLEHPQNHLETRFRVVSMEVSIATQMRRSSELNTSVLNGSYFLTREYPVIILKDHNVRHLANYHGKLLFKKTARSASKLQVGTVAGCCSITVQR